MPVSSSSPAVARRLGSRYETIGGARFSAVVLILFIAQDDQSSELHVSAHVIHSITTKYYIFELLHLGGRFSLKAARPSLILVPVSSSRTSFPAL
jgi:hypothetical protein